MMDAGSGSWGGGDLVDWKKDVSIQSIWSFEMSNRFEMLMYGSQVPLSVMVSNVDLGNKGGRLMDCYLAATTTWHRTDESRTALPIGPFKTCSDGKQMKEDKCRTRSSGGQRR